MTQSLVLVDSGEQQITTITLNRSEKRNALSICLMEQLCDAIEGIDASQRVIIIKGAGTAFCAGLDLEEAADPSVESAYCVSRLLNAVYTSPLITIAAVHGAAIAGGAGLMAACDCVVAAEGTLVGYPEVRRGLVAAQVMTFLRRQLREREARELLLFGELIDAKRAQTLGMINCVTSQEEYENVAKDFAQLALKAAPKAAAQTKKLLNTLYPSDFRKDLDKALKYFQKMRHSEEAEEGIAAFLEKREPKWR